jgi:hypothetical protein
MLKNKLLETKMSKSLVEGFNLLQHTRSGSNRHGILTWVQNILQIVHDDDLLRRRGLHEHDGTVSAMEKNEILILSKFSVELGAI